MRQQETRRLGLLLAALSLAGAACGELQQDRFVDGQGSLSGVVVDSANRPAQAIVSFGFDAHMGSGRTTTLSNGTFVFRRVPVGQPQVAAFDSQGRFAVSRVRVIGETMNQMPALVLGTADPGGAYLPELLVESRLTLGPQVEQVLAAKSGELVLYRTVDTESWTAAAMERPAALREIAQFDSLPSVPQVLDDQYIYGGTAGHIWRLHLQSQQLEQSGPFGTLREMACTGVTQAVLCWTSVQATPIFEDLMGGDLLLWRHGQAAAEPITDHNPNGLDFPTLSPNGRQIAYVERTFGLTHGTVLVLYDFASNTKQRQTFSEIHGLAYGPGGQLVVVSVDPQGLVVLSAVDTAAATTLPAMDAPRVDAFGYNISRDQWLLQVWTGETTLFSLQPDLTLNADTPTAGITTWDYNAGAVAFQDESAGFRQIFTNRGGVISQITILAAQHSLVGWGAQGKSLLHLTRDPKTGVTQLFSSAVFAE